MTNEEPKLRDYFAMSAMQSLVHVVYRYEVTKEQLTKMQNVVPGVSYAIADMMLEERKKRQTDEQDD